MWLYLITRNKGKLLAANSVFDKFGIQIKPVEKDYPEIQATSSLEIAKFTAIQAAQELQHGAIREDHSLFINALGIPGPYTSYIEKNLPAGKLLEILDGFSDRSGFFEIATVYAEPNGTTKEFVYQVPVEIATQEKGNLQSGWSRIIMLQGEHRTFAEYPETERTDVWNKNYKAIAEYLNQKPIRPTNLH